MIKRYQYIYLSIFLYQILFFFSVGKIFAQETENTSLSFSVSPVINEFEIKTQEKKLITFTIQNKNNFPLNLEIFTLPFIPHQENGQVDFQNPDNKTANWFKINNNQLPQNININGNGKYTFSLEIFVPRNTPEGDYYQSLFFSSHQEDQPEKKTPANKSFNLKQEVQIVSLLFFRVGRKPVPVNISLEDLSQSRFTVNNQPISLHLNLKNSGHNYQKIAGIIELTTIFKEKVADIPFSPTILLADTSKIIKVDLTRYLAKPHGIYQATVFLDASKAQIGSPHLLIFLSKDHLIVIATFIIFLFLFLIAKKIVFHNQHN